MAQIKLEPEVENIFVEIDKGNNFLLSGGAGSGKTYSLVHTIKTVIAKYPTVKIACMTYTNAAVKQIEERVDHKNLNVTTIHDFLWDNIKSFQTELKSALIDLINDPLVTKIKSSDGIVPLEFFNGLKDGIQYKEWVRINDGIISHDEVISLATIMFKNYPKLCDIVKDRFKFIFIDEYQDTHKEVVEIFLTHLKQSQKQNIIGFFGDSMQSIYDEGIGDLFSFIASNDVVEIQKTQNRRNPLSVINLANTLRSDGIIQVPSVDINAPNMSDGVVLPGSIKFYYSTEYKSEELYEILGWDFNDTAETKELNLTHNLIAPKAGFSILMEIYDKDPITSLKSDISRKIKERSDKGLPPIEYTDDNTFDEVIEKFDIRTSKKKGEFEAKKKKDILLENPETAALYEKVKDKPYGEVRKIYLDKSSLIDDKKQNKSEEKKKGSKRDNLIKHLFKIQHHISLYRENNINEFIRKTDFTIRSIADKRQLRDIITALEKMSDNSIEQVINYAHEKGICIKDDSFNRFTTENEYTFDRVKVVPFGEFQNLYHYLQGYTPFSTQHKVKGSEFDKVVVILDNGKWFDYNFEYLFEKRTDKESVVKRTEKLFYVCCTRAKKELAVYFQNPNANIIHHATALFGAENLIKF